MTKTFLTSVCLVLLIPLCPALNTQQLAAQDKSESAKKLNQKDASKQPKKAPELKLISEIKGDSLGNWKVLKEGLYKKSGGVKIKNGVVEMIKGTPGTGIIFDKDAPKINYEISFEAMRTDGGDFFSGITFPVKKDNLTFIVGGWGGTTIGISNLDGMSAIENETTDFIKFKNDQWYKIRLRVTDEKIQGWIDDEQYIDLKTGAHKYSIWFEVKDAAPLGITTWYTSAKLRNIQLSKVIKKTEK